uniref:Uncharacterized protein n=1 Tax=Oryza glumipatula TaxID=40148 RepID=A0A0E0B798_9ORYZ
MWGLRALSFSPATCFLPKRRGMASDWPAVAMWTLTLGRRSTEPKQFAWMRSPSASSSPPPPSDVRGKWRRCRDASLPFPDHGESECAAAFLPQGTNLRVVMASPLVGAGAGGHHESRP